MVIWGVFFFFPKPDPSRAWAQAGPGPKLARAQAGPGPKPGPNPSWAYAINIFSRETLEAAMLWAPDRKLKIWSPVSSEWWWVGG